MITIKNLCKTYGKGDAVVKALNGVDLTISDGELISFIGKSGSGKTTLLNLLGGLDSATSGNVFFDNDDITKMKDHMLADFRLKKIGFVFQFFDLIPELTAQENILLPLRLAKKKDFNLKLIAEQLHIEDKLKYYPSELSGGQQQRVAIARALANEPKIILADEPTGALDTKTSTEIMALFCELNKKGHTIIIITHDLEIAKQCSRIVEISDGKILK